MVRRIGIAMAGERGYRWATYRYDRAVAAVAAASWRQHPATAASRARLEELRGAFRGQRCFIIGNGPSLRETNLQLLAGELTIGSNALFLNYHRMRFEPTFLTVEDILVAQDRAAALNDRSGSIKVIPWDLRRWLLPAQDTVYVYFDRRTRPPFPFSADLRSCAYWGGTVTYLNMQLAFHLRCDPIILVGVDHSYVLPAETPSADHDFVIRSASRDPNHFDPDYFGPGYRWHNPKVARMEQAYESARSFAAQRGFRILNATIGGMLEVFPRVEFGSLFPVESAPAPMDDSADRTCADE